MKTSSSTKREYAIQPAYFLSHTRPSPYHTKGRYISCPYILHDKEHKKDILEVHFRSACEMLSQEIGALKTLNKKVTEREQEMLVTSLVSLLDLHTILQEK